MNKRCSIKFKVVGIALILDVVLGYLYFSATKLILTAGGEIFQSQISNCSYYAIEDCLNENIDFASICKIEKTNDGSISFIQTNTQIANYIVKKISLDCFDYMDAEIKKGFKIPFGVFTGVKILAGFGPEVNIKLATALSVECKIERTFASVGINQTRQTLSAIIVTDITVFAPLYNKKYNGKIEMILFDNVIVGKVPSVFLNTKTLTSDKIDYNTQN